MLWALAMLVGCGGDAEPSPSATGDTGEDASWTLVVAEGPGGMMLAGYSAGDTMLVVGGQLDGSTGTVWKLRGDEMCVEEGAADRPIWWVHGRSATDYWMVGEQGLVVHEVDGVRTDESLATTAKLFGVFDDGSDVWAVGGDINTNVGEVWRRSEGGWALVTETPGLAFKVWEGWVVGDGFAWRWNGSGFDDLTPPGAPRLTTVRGRDADNDVYVVGGLQVAEFHHFDGSTWSKPELDPVCTGGAFNGVYTAPGEDVFVAGMFGVASAWDGEGWGCAEQPLTADHFHAIWPHEGSWYALGGNFMSTSNQHATVARYGRGPAAFDIKACDSLRSPSAP